MMLGRHVEKTRRQPIAVAAEGVEPIVRLDGVFGEKVNGVSFDVHPGEIVGLAGLQGSGCTEVAELLFGAKQPQQGSILFRGERVEFAHPREAVAAGIALVTEDRHLDGSFLDQSVAENMSVTDVNRFFRRGWLSKRRERVEVNGLIERFQIHPAQGARRFSNLSGGNQQKAVLAKWLRMKPTLLICDQPDVGVDIGAKQSIYAAIVGLVESGSGAILISNQYDDLESLCDRVAILRGGKVVAVLTGDEVNEIEISRIVVGGAAAEVVGQP
jgi:ribose transport system ATP-binding protein